MQSHPLTSHRNALLALAVDRTLPMDTRYRLALNLDALMQRNLPALKVAATAEIKPEAVTAGRSVIAQQDVVRAMKEKAHKLGATVVTAADPAYPTSLRELELPPPCLFCRTAPASRHSSSDVLAVLQAPGIGIVGPRNADPYGLQAARLFAADLAEAGLVITSGFARGVDAAAHQEAARSDCPTLAILGCGIDIPYPKQNQSLIEPILDAGGMIVSEFPFGTPPAGWRFPIRNRIIAALTLGMLVVQASLRSGSLISARLALECGREVFAVPGRIFDQRSRGTNLLLKDGAHVALSPQSILDTLPLNIREEILRKRLGDDTALRQTSLLDRLARESQSAEELSIRLGLPIDTILADLTEMELTGSIDRRSGGRFVASS